ncbi:uncharacterized protein E0L32_005004 [Thyridium curvatum]|uniref:Uncharacterized protein n=1 Tax=Thyridium curvatum TaxID=1093900 RepID=A0A507AVS1_9PEZI|nr:uncharacterized protein E0L32_005004 [Thyridium curvatum]TPX14895.1 hypothetical protein E0L32_005004 [Thyridium curvatum]
MFGNLEPLTDGTIAPAKPDIYYGACPEELSLPVRDELGHHLIPSTMQDKPLAPNFSLRLKDRMGPSEYHMTEVNGYYMTGNREGFAQGATAVRNVRDLAKQHRERFIQAANAKASQRERTTTPAGAAEFIEDEVSTPFGSTNHSHSVALQGADYELQHSIAGSHYDSEDDGGAYPVPHYPEDEIQEASPTDVAPSDDPSMSFTASSTSGFTTDRSQSKRSRPSVSPPSKASGSHESKRRTRSRTGRLQDSPQQPTMMENSVGSKGSLEGNVSDEGVRERSRSYGQGGRVPFLITSPGSTETIALEGQNSGVGWWITTSDEEREVCLHLFTERPEAAQ